ncbi:hypothetical protein VNO80_17891 [Phaseolus coccineus]|uniref:Uncharacterized protein n=1 Tax=Phaseolus coccineus TaxID=3886 RepID=A0AAN9MD73_PHACN
MFPIKIGFEDCLLSRSYSKVSLFIYSDTPLVHSPVSLLCNHSFISFREQQETNNIIPLCWTKSRTKHRETIILELSRVFNR